MEGDLIEALNAGDGLWWTGRLRRDPRAIGSFPSNFVKVLDESFQPAPNSRNASPRNTPPRQTSSPTKQKSVFRKPFQAYGVVNGNGTSERENTSDSDKEKLKREKSKFRPYASMKTAQAPRSNAVVPVNDISSRSEDTFRMPAPPPRNRRPVSRAASPLPAQERGMADHTRSDRWSANQYAHVDHLDQHASRAPSPSLVRPNSPLPSTFHDGSAYPQLLSSRTPSPQPPLHTDHQHDHALEDASDDDHEPPPPPPAHRVLYQPSRPASPTINHEEERHMSHTPVPPSPGGSHMTPSPLRDAMNDVMSSLQDMSMDTGEHESVANGVWSPDEFELVRSRSYQRHHSHSNANYGNSYSNMREELPTAHSHSYLPAVPLKGSQHPPARQASRPTTSSSNSSCESGRLAIRNRKSAYELGSRRLDRTYTTKTNATNSTESSSATQSSNSTQMTSRSIMSGYSAGGFSATSAGSLARRKFGLGSQRRSQRPMSMFDTRSMVDLTGNTRSMADSETSGSGPSYHDSHASREEHEPATMPDWTSHTESAGIFGGLGAPKKKKSGFFRKMIESAKTTAMTGAATARATVSSVSRPGSRAGGSPTKTSFLNGREMVGFGGGSEPSRPTSATSTNAPARDMGLGNGNEWMQVRRDVNRSNSLSQRERDERHDKAEMLDVPACRPVEEFLEHVEGDESLDGFAVAEPADLNTTNLALVDKSVRFVNSIPPMVNPAALAQTYLCRQYRSDVQRLRAIFTWTAERITWEDDFEGEPNPRRVLQTKRGCSEEIAILVREMCSAVGIHSEIIRGYLKKPGDIPDADSLARGNHWWNAVVVDGEWRILDASLASPSHPRRAEYSGASSQAAESWYFLARPTEICYTHIPLLPEQQHIVPPVEHEILAALPCACPAYFRYNSELAEFDTGMLHMEGLEMAHIHVFVPEDIECVADAEARSYARDSDGDVYESDELVTKPALTQPEWISGRKRFTIKALLPPDTSTGTIKVYAGKRGLMHSVKDNPHSLAFALPLTHTGQNAPYDFVVRHPTPHAQRHDLYVAQPQCYKLVMNNTFVFSIRQHPSALSRFTPDTWGGASSTAGNRPSSPAPFARPGSAMSMMSSAASMSFSVSGSQYSDSSSSASGSNMTASQTKPAKLAIQSPSQKIIRLSRKQENRHDMIDEATGQSMPGLASTWETIIKIGEKGIWRGLVLADRSARWCVFAEWECV